MENNPWHVDSVQAFTFLKCPECIFDTKEEAVFQDHAVENHPLSFVLFSKKLKEEEFDENSEYIDYEPDNTENICLSPISSNVIEIKEEPPEARTRLNDILVSCEICNEQFSKKRDLSSHYAAVHEGIQSEAGKKLFKCPKCDVKYPSKAKVRYHIKRSIFCR